MRYVRKWLEMENGKLYSSTNERPSYHLPRPTYRAIIKPKTSKQSPCRKDNVCLCIIIIILFFCGWDIKKQKRVDYYNVDSHTHIPPNQPPVSFVRINSIMYMLVMYVGFGIYVYINLMLINGHLTQPCDILGHTESHVYRFKQK